MLESDITLNLPYITADLPGIGGKLRVNPDHFVVEEVPLYEAEGQGQHLYVNLTKVGLTTKDVQRQLEQLFGLPRGDVGYAGLKDKQARTTQTFSLGVERYQAGQIDELINRIAAELPVTLNWARLHKNKLKPGHLLGNRFRITITDLAATEDETQRRVKAIVGRLQRTGVPNFFGPQRLGTEGANVIQGRQVLVEHRQVHDRWLRRFLVGSYQSYLCNRYLAQRMVMGAFEHLVAGDIAKKYDTGGMFEVEDLATEQARYAAHQLSFTAPMYGPKMWTASGASGELELAILAETGVTLEDFRRAKVEGSRRLGRLLVPDLRTQHLENALITEFFLPKGAFATTVLREFMKLDLLDAPEIDGDDGS